MSGILKMFVQQGCATCTEQKKVLKKVTTAVTIEVIDCGEQEAVADLYKVRSTPSFVGVKDGTVVFKKAGYFDEKRLKGLLARLE